MRFQEMVPDDSGRLLPLLKGMDYGMFDGLSANGLRGLLSDNLAGRGTVTWPDGRVVDRVPGMFLACFLPDDPMVAAVASLRFGNTPELLSWPGHMGYHVRPALRGMGIGKTLAKAGADILRRKGFSPFRISCDPRNALSRRIIAGLGGKLLFEGVVGPQPFLLFEVLP